VIELETHDGRVVNLVEHARELPEFTGVQRVYADCETTSGDPKVKAFKPYGGHRIAGVAVLRDDEATAWYVPVRHKHGRNIPAQAVRRWLRDMMTVPEWVNHNVKFDAHFVACAGRGDELVFPGRMIDTATLAKCHDTDRMGHGLKAVCADWLEQDLSEQDEVEAYLKNEKTKDYGELPADLCGRYAGQDVLMNRELMRFLEDQRPEQMRDTWETEILLTPVLFDIERAGMRVNDLAVKKLKVKTLRSILGAQQEIVDLTDGREFVDSSKNLYDLIVNVLGLPVLKWNTDPESKERGSPSFDKEALELYGMHPEVLHQPRNARVIELIKSARAESHFLSNYLEVFGQAVETGGFVHPSFNQLIRTGRMSASDPNVMGMSKAAKDLIIPDDDEYGILTADAEQIEFRLIVHYIRDADAIAAYARDPDTDFHMWAARLCEVERTPAKTLNFAMGYGAGKKRVVSLLLTDPTIMHDVGEIIAQQIEEGRVPERLRAQAYHRLCERRAQGVYTRYHERLPGIKRTSRAAAQKCIMRGYVFNPFGRRRHLPPRAAHKAFNTIVQGGAMDIIKRRMIRLAPRYNSWVRNSDIRLFGNVHDELPLHGPREALEDPKIQARIHAVLETTDIDFRVPFTWEAGYSPLSWKAAGAKENVIDKIRLRKIALEEGFLGPQMRRYYE